MVGTPDLEEQTLRLFVGLRLHRTEWAGALLVGLGLTEAGRALAMATLAAGAAGLFLEDDAAEVRVAQRAGCCMFTVTALPEAIRILKNEVRQRRGVTVVLRLPPAAALEEMVLRGVQPQAVVCSRAAGAEESALLHELCSRGAEEVLLEKLECVEDIGHLQPGRPGHWHVHRSEATNLQERRSRDLDLLASAAEGTDDWAREVAVAWLRVAPVLFPRSLSRVALLSSPTT